jgi:hypothetical protein
LCDEEFKFYADGSNLHSWGKTGYNRPGGNFTLADFGIVPGVYDVVFQEFDTWKPGNPKFIFVRPFRWT